MMLVSTKSWIGHPIEVVAETVGNMPFFVCRNALKPGFAATANSPEHLSVRIRLCSEFGFWISAGAIE
jgi:hypothetical protein